MQVLKSVDHALLTESVLKALGQSRIITLIDFLQEETEKLSIISTLSITEVLTLRSYIFSKYSAPLINGSTLLERYKLLKKEFIETGLPSLDMLLNGGLPVGHITEIFGLADSGKTQLCLQVAMNCVKNTDRTVLYIDTKGDFSAIRVQKILDAQGFSHKDMAVIMHQIKVIHLWNIEELIELLQKIKNKKLNFTDLSMIIIDSLPCLMFQYLGDDNKIGLAFLNKLVNYCRFLCGNMSLSIICVNIQTRWVDQDVSDLDDVRQQSVMASKDMSYVEKHNRCLGNYWRQVPMLLLLLEKAAINDSSNEHNIFITNVSSSSKRNNVKQCVLKLNTCGITCLNN